MNKPQSMGAPFAALLLGLGLLGAALAPRAAWAQAGGARVLPMPGAKLARRRPPTVRAIKTVAGCKAQIVLLAKQQRCLRCIERGGRFQDQELGEGFCVERDQKLLRIRQLKGCVFHLGKGRERNKCRRCLKGGGIYRYWSKGKGICNSPRLAAPLLKQPSRRQHPGEVRLVEDCAVLIRRADKQRRCANCINKGGVFFRQGAGSGRCKVAPSGPPDPGPAEESSLKSALRQGIGSDQACREQVPQAPRRRLCQRCVEQGGWFYPHRSVCGPPQGLAPVLSLAECPLQVSGPDLLARCRECLRQGGKFYPGGYCRVKPPPLPPEEERQKKVLRAPR